MPSIADVLKEKTGKTGSNISEVLSNMDFNGGGSASNGFTVVDITIDPDSDPDNHVYVLSKTVGELLEAVPFIIVRYHSDETDAILGIRTIDEYVSFLIDYGSRYEDNELRAYTFTFKPLFNDGKTCVFGAESLDDYPTYQVPK